MSGLCSSSAVRVPGLRRLALAAVVLAILATPMALGLYAKDRDKPDKESRLKEKENKLKDRDKDKSRDKGNQKSTVAARQSDETGRLGAAEIAKTRLTPALEAGRASRDAVRKLAGYSCTFIKQEQLKKSPAVRQVMLLKFRREPFSVYLKFVEPHAGREVIYVDGRNKGKLQVHEASGLASVIGTISLSPTGAEAMKESRYPVTMIGMEKMLEVAMADWEAAEKHTSVRVETYPQAKIGDSSCTMFEVVFAKPHESIKFHKTRMYFDKLTNLPVRVEQYAFPEKAGEEAPLVEEYTYADLKTGAALSDADFDVGNGSYGFK